MKIKLLIGVLFLHVGLLFAQTEIDETHKEDISLRAILTPPGVPYSSNTQATSLSLTWAPSQGSTRISYDVFVDNRNRGNTMTNVFLLTGLSPATTYSIYVVAYDMAGTGAGSSMSVATNIRTASTTTPSPGCDATHVLNRDYTNSSTTTFEATKSIRMTPGFRFAASGNKTFKARIVVCPSSFAIYENDREEGWWTGGADSELFMQKVEIYPNPVKTLLTINLGNEYQNVKELQIYNASGGLIKRQERASSIEQIDMQNYPNGFYILRILYKDGRMESRKFVLSK